MMPEEPIHAPIELIEIAQKMGLSHPIEALLCAPRRFEDYRKIWDDFSDLQANGPLNEFVVYRASIGPSMRGFGRRGVAPPPGGYQDSAKLLLRFPFTRGVFRLEVDLVDTKGRTVTQSVFGDIFSWKDIAPGDEVVLRGKLEQFAGRWQFNASTFVDPQDLHRVAPVYLGEAGKKVSRTDVSALIRWVNEDDERLAMAVSVACERIRQACGGLEDESILAACGVDPTQDYSSLESMILALHYPSTPEEGNHALDIVRKVCVLSMQCTAARVNSRAPCPGSAIADRASLQKSAQDLMLSIESRRAAAGFSLTKNQRDVVSAVCNRLSEDVPLNGLLNGEVGAGKTVAYMVPAVAAHLAGARVGIIAPTDLLAEQIANNIANEFGAMVSVERVRQGRKIRNPSAILVGTIGLNTAAQKIGWQPDFLIFDEQHKIHTAAREALLNPSTHTLEVTATPIPRSLGLSLYGGMDVFTLNEQPVVKSIQTGLIDTKDRSIATRAIRQAIANGKRVAIVYTLVDQPEREVIQDDEDPGINDVPQPSKTQLKEMDAKGRKSAIEAAAAFETHFPDRVGLLHGKMSQDEKIDALNRFRSGEKPLVVTTTVFETGIDVPDVQVIIIRDPEHLGASQLHQLRGRVARSGGDGLCLLLTADLDQLGQETYDRLSAFCATTDGYELATLDMLSRGVGQLDGLVQNGKSNMVFRSVKMSTRDLVAFDSARPNLQIEHDPAVKRADSSRSAQRALFT